MPLDRIHRIGAFLVCATLVAAAPALSQELYFNDFDGGETFGAGVGGALSGEVSTEPGQGFVGLGPVGGEFAGDLLRNTSATVPGAATTLTLTGLPPHASISISLLFAAIDSWDGDLGGGDFFEVNVDGATVFRESFLNSTAPAMQSYAGPALAFRQNLGFGGGLDFLDSAYDLSAELERVPHSADTLTLELFADGPHWQGGADESWGVDNLLVEVPEPAPFAEALVGAALLVGFARRRGGRARGLPR
jgi:hypothetical protein